MSRLTDQMERVLGILRSYYSPSSKEIEDKANVCSARDWIRHLRDKGFTITRSEERINGTRICRWHLEETSPVARELFQQ